MHTAPRAAAHIEVILFIFKPALELTHFYVLAHYISCNYVCFCHETALYDHLYCLLHVDCQRSWTEHRLGSIMHCIENIRHLKDFQGFSFQGFIIFKCSRQQWWWIIHATLSERMRFFVEMSKFWGRLADKKGSLRCARPRATLRAQLSIVQYRIFIVCKKLYTC